MTSRVGRGLVVVLALASIDTARAQSQPAATGSGSATPAAATNGEATDDEEGGSGSGSALVAPTDPKQRGKWLADQLDAAINARPLLTSRAKIGVEMFDLATWG